MEEFLQDIKPDLTEKRIALFMEHGAGYSTRYEIHFSREHPYQLVDAEEVLSLLATGRFRVATPQEVKDFYGVQ